MKKKTIILLSLFTSLLLLLSACGNSKQSTKSASAEKNTTPTSQGTNASSKSQTKSSSNADSKSLDPNLMLLRMDSVIKATLTLESKTKNTKVNYKMKTMTQDGKKVSFSIVPDANHQSDFMQGTIHGLIYDGSQSHDKTFYNFLIDKTDHLSLIDPTSKKVVYTTTISSQPANATNGAY